jgi:hypothetical protein
MGLNQMIETFNHFKAMFADMLADMMTDMMAGLSQSVFLLFEYAILIGVREENLVLILVTAVLSVLLLVLLIIMLIRGRFGGRGKKNPKKSTPAAPPLEQGIPPADSSADGLKADDRPDASATENLDPAFTIFKKPKTKAGQRQAKDNSDIAAEMTHGRDDDILTLSEIEQEMMALKELYATGHIELDVYVQESKALYDKAKNLT